MEKMLGNKRKREEEKKEKKQKETNSLRTTY